MQLIRTTLASTRVRLAVLTAAMFGLTASPTFAAADSATGIDWSSVGDSVLTSAKPAILAGLAIMAVVLAVQLGRSLFKKVAK